MSRLLLVIFLSSSLISQDFPFFKQGSPDSFWFTKDYKGAYPKQYCGIVAVQNVLSYYDINRPRDFLAFKNTKGEGFIRSTRPQGQMFVINQGVWYNPMVDLLRIMGLKRSFINYRASFNDLIPYSKAKIPIIVSIKGFIKYKGLNPRMTAGHVIVILDYNKKTNMLLVADSLYDFPLEINKIDFLKIWNRIMVVPLF